MTDGGNRLDGECTVRILLVFSMDDCIHEFVVDRYRGIGIG